MPPDEQNNSNTTTEPSRSRDPLVGTTLDGRFRVEELIGSGGMSNVYRATQLRVNRDVAIKTLKVQVDQPVYRERFQREIDLLCALSHPNIVTVYDCLLGPDDQPCVVMDYLRGRSLEQLLIDEGPLSADRFARIFVQVLSALDHAHRKGVVHRDIKPGNIVMLDRETDYIKVVDFGLAKFNQESRRLTHTGELWGSPPYMSPEQCMGKPDSERSDIYSVGVVMYELITGKDPFHHATTIFELIQCHVNTPPPPFNVTNPLINVPPQLEEAVFKAMAKDQADRPQTANELKDAIVAACINASGSSGAFAGAHPGDPGSSGNRPAGDSIWIGGAPGAGDDAASRPAGDSIWVTGTKLDAAGGAAASTQSGGAYSAEYSGESGSTDASYDDSATSSTGFGGGHTSSSGLSGAFARHGGATNTGYGGSNRSESVSPWSREGAARAAAADGESVASRGSFGAAQDIEHCAACAKPVQKQRRGSMTSWILADHHRVMEKISGACMCPPGEPSSEHAKTPVPVRAESVGDTGMQMAKLLARQGMPRGFEEAETAKSKPEPLFEEPSRAASRSTSMRFTADQVTANRLVGNQIVVAIFALIIVGALIFGAVQFFSGMKSQSSSTSAAVSPAPAMDSAEADTSTMDESGKETEKPKPEKTPEPARTSPKKPQHKSKPALTAAPSKPKTAPSAKPGKPTTDPWAELDLKR